MKENKRVELCCHMTDPMATVDGTSVPKLQINVSIYILTNYRDVGLTATEIAW